MLKLILMRHAKSDWGSLNLSDKERPLNKRGRAAAPKIAAWLGDRDHQPDHVLVSSAARTLETWDLMQELFPTATVETSDALYLADPRTLAEHIKSKSAQSLMLIAHNPGIAWLAQTLVKEAPQHTKFNKYPTSATLVAQFAISGWRELKVGSGTALDFVVPSDLV